MWWEWKGAVCGQRARFGGGEGWSEGGEGGDVELARLSEAAAGGCGGGERFCCADWEAHERVEH